MEFQSIDSLTLAHRIVDLVSDIKGENIVVLDLRELTQIADYFVICSANSERQLKALIDKVGEGVREELKVKPFHVEGQSEGGWVLMDYSTVILHAFSPEQRKHYDLEGFWNRAKTILRVQ